MGQIEPYVVKQLVAASRELHASRLYDRYSDTDCFLLRLPKLEHPAVAMLMGHGGETFGLSLLLGPEAVDSFEALVMSGGGSRGQYAMGRSQMIGYQMTEAWDLSHDARRWLKKAKVRPAGQGLYPDPMALEPGKLPRVLLTDRESRWLVYAARGIVAASSDKRFTPRGIGPDGRMLCVTVTGDQASPSASIGWEGVGGAAGPSPAGSGGAQSGGAQQVALASPRFDLSGLESSGDQWLVLMMPAPAAIEGDDRQPYMMIVCSERTSDAWPMIVMGGDSGEVVDALARLMRGEHESAGGLFGERPATAPPKGLPEALVLDSPAICDAVRPAFEPLGVACHDGSDDAGVQMMVEQMEQTLATGIDDEANDWIADTLEHRPGDDDIHGWKRVDGYLKDKIHEAFDSDDRFFGVRALDRYFGPYAHPEELLDRYRRLMVVDSYALWFTVSYRSARNRPTLAERWLKDQSQPLPGAVRELLEAVIAHGPSIYRVEEADEDTGKITLIDVFTGEMTIATDFALSTCLDPGLLMPARLVPAGDFHLLYAAGPLMAGSFVSNLMDFFDEEKIAPSPELFAEQPHLLGWLWEEMDTARQAGVSMHNTDGHAMVFHTAVFACADRPALERWLEDQPDWHIDDDDAEQWVWFKPQVPSSGADTVADTDDGPRTLLGRLAFDGDGFTLTTNSAQRHEAARALLEQVNGVALESVEVQDPADMKDRDGAAGGDDSVGGAEEAPLDADDVAAARQYLERHYRRWLDVPIPALKDKTPREAAADPKLRPRLAALVRSIPDPVGIEAGGVQIAAPRAMLLAELGLDE